MPAEPDDYDDGLITRSPPLQKSQPRLGPSESPPPFDLSQVVNSSSSSVSPPPSGHRARRKRSNRRHQKNLNYQGDVVLLNQLDPNRPDIARSVLHRPLPSADSEAEESDADVDMAQDDREERAHIAIAALGLIHDHHTPPEEPEVQDSSPKPSTSLLNGGKQSDQNGRSAMHPPDTMKASRSSQHKENSTSKSGQNRKDSTTSTDSAAGRGSAARKDSSSKADRPSPRVITTSPQCLATSPNLRKYTITASEGSPEETLPALHKSPPQSGSMQSPNGSQNLPSLKSTLGRDIVEEATGGTDTPYLISAVSPPGSGPPSHTFSPYAPVQAPQHNRPNPPNQYVNTHFSPPNGVPSSQTSPESGISPPSTASTGASHPGYWRNAPKGDKHYSTLSYGSSPYSASTNESPSTNGPTPTDQSMSTDGDRPLHSQIQPHGPFATSLYKCTHPGCTAAPFQTHYLLK